MCNKVINEALTTTSQAPSVSLSVRRSHADCWHWVKTTQARITKSSPTDSPRTLVFGFKSSSRKSKCSPRARALNESVVGKIRNFQPISRRISEAVQDRPTINDYSRIRSFDWCPNQRPWMTLNGRYALYCRQDAFLEPTTKISMKIDPYYQLQNVGQWP